MSSHLIVLLHLSWTRTTWLIANYLPITCARLNHWVRILSDQNLDLYDTKDLLFWILPYYLIQFFLTLSFRYQLPNFPLTRIPLDDMYNEWIGPLMYISYANWLWTAARHLWTQPGVARKLCSFVDIYLEGCMVLTVMWLALDLITILAYRAFGLRAVVNTTRQIIGWD